MAVNCDITTEQGKVYGNECFDIVKSSQTYTVPCTRSVCEAYTVKIPKTKAITVNKQVPYIDYETQTEQVPYQYVQRQTVTRNVPTCRTVPMVKSVCTSVPTKRRGIGFGRRCYVKKKCPRTVYVSQKCCEQRQFCQSIPRTGWKTVQKSVPVQKFRNETEVKYKTEMVPEVRYRTRTSTKMVNKTVPVFNVVTKPQNIAQPRDILVQTIPARVESTALQPLNIVSNNTIAQSSAVKGFCPELDSQAMIPEITSGVVTSSNGYNGIQQVHETAAVVSDFNRIDKNGDGMLSYGEVVFDNADANKDGVLDINEYKTGYGTGVVGREVVNDNGLRYNTSIKVE